jgi:hypothetical protein
MILILSSIDRTFNLSRLSASFDEASNRFSAFANDILEEMAKPSRDRRNGTNFLHDMSTEKRRIDEQVQPVPWFIEKLFIMSKRRRNPVAQTITQQQNKGDEIRHAAARTIQRAWFKHLVEIPNPSTVARKIIKTRKLLTLPEAVIKSECAITIPTSPSLVHKKSLLKYQQQRFENAVSNDQILHCLTKKENV